MTHALLELSLSENPLGLFLAAAPAVLNGFILWHALRNLPRDRLTRVFTFFVAMLLAWQAFDVAIRCATNPETASMWRALLRVGQFFAIPAGLHFALLFSERARLARSAATLTLLYLPPMLFESFYSAGLIQEELLKVQHWGWIADPNQGPWFTVVTIWYSVEAALIPAVLYWNLVRTRHEPAQFAAARMLAVGITIPVVIGVFTEAVMPQLLGIRQIPVTSTTLSAFSIATVVALTRYNLFRVSTLAAAQAVIETVSDSLLITDSRGTLLFANPVARTTYGLERQGIGQTHLHDLFGGETFGTGVWDGVLAGKAQSAVEATLQLSDGREIPVLVSMAPLEVSRNGPPGVVLLVHDVSKLKMVEAELAAARDIAEEASRSKSMFLANMSHELRTPLNAIIGYSQMLSEEADEQAARDLHRIEASGEYLLQLINDVLDLSKVESNKLEIRMKPFCLSELTEELEPVAREICRRQANELTVSIDGQPTVHGDRTRVRQVMLNLLSNAAKFTQQGEIQLAASTDEGWVQVDVRDTGIGMDEEQLAGLFGLFAQVHREGHDKYGGSGLGLALSRRLCQLMGGDITVKSARGQGTTFTVRLPAGESAPPPPA